MIEIKAEVAGTVWKVFARQGDAVVIDETLIIIESMKMEIPVACDQAGTIKELLVAEGEAVHEGQVLARLIP